MVTPILHLNKDARKVFQHAGNRSSPHLAVERRKKCLGSNVIDCESLDQNAIGFKLTLSVQLARNFTSMNFLVANDRLTFPNTLISQSPVTRFGAVSETEVIENDLSRSFQKP